MRISIPEPAISSTPAPTTAGAIQASDGTVSAVSMCPATSGEPSAFMATLLGGRLRPEAGVTYEAVARLANATMRGLVIMGPSSPEIGAGRFTADPAGAPQEAQWSHPALGLAALVIAFIEPGPEVEWTAQDTERFRAELSAEDWLTTTSTKPQ